MLASCGGNELRVYGVDDDHSLSHQRTVDGLHGYNISALSWNHTNQVVAIAGSEAKISLVQASNGQLLSTLPFSVAEANAFAGETRAVAFSSNSRYLASSSSRSVNLWDLKRRQLRASFTGHRAAVTTLSVAAEGDIIAGDAAGAIRLWNLRSGESSAEMILADEGRTYGSVVCSQASQLGPARVAAGYESGDLALWDLQTNACVRQQHAHTSNIMSVAYSPKNSRLVASCGMDGQVLLMDTGVRSSEPSAVITVGEPLRCLTFHEGAIHCAIGSEAGTLAVYDWRNVRQPVWVAEAHNPFPVSALAYQNASYGPSTTPSKIFGSARSTTSSANSSVNPQQQPPRSAGKGVIQGGGSGAANVTNSPARDRSLQSATAVDQRSPKRTTVDVGGGALTPSRTVRTSGADAVLRGSLDSHGTTMSSLSNSTAHAKAAHSQSVFGAGSSIHGGPAGTGGGGAVAAGSSLPPPLALSIPSSKPTSSASKPLKLPNSSQINVHMTAPAPVMPPPPPLHAQIPVSPLQIAGEEKRGMAHAMTKNYAKDAAGNGGISDTVAAAGVSRSNNIPRPYLMPDDLVFADEEDLFSNVRHSQGGTQQSVVDTGASVSGTGVYSSVFESESIEAVGAVEGVGVGGESPILGRADQQQDGWSTQSDASESAISAPVVARMSVTSTSTAAAAEEAIGYQAGDNVKRAQALAAQMAMSAAKKQEQQQHEMQEKESRRLELESHHQQQQKRRQQQQLEEQQLHQNQQHAQVEAHSSSSVLSSVPDSAVSAPFVAPVPAAAASSSSSGTAAAAGEGTTTAAAAAMAEDYASLRLKVQPVSSAELQDSLHLLRYDIHREISAITREQLRLYELQRSDMQQLVAGFQAQLAEVLQANKELRAENEKLRQIY